MRIPLDHNFPEPILDCLTEYLPEPELVPIRRIDGRLPGLDDRQLILALHQLGYQGLVTLNYKMLSNPAELATVIATKMTVFAIEGVGHDPVRATGALLLDLPSAVQAMTAGQGEVFLLRPRSPTPVEAWELFKRSAERRHQAVNALFDEVRVSPEELASPVLAPPPTGCPRTRAGLPDS